MAMYLEIIHYLSVLLNSSITPFQRRSVTTSLGMGMSSTVQWELGEQSHSIKIAD